MRLEVRLVFGALVLMTGSARAADLQSPAPTSALPLNHETSEPATAPPVEGTVHPESPTNEELTANFSISNPTVASLTYTPFDTAAHPDTPSFLAAAESLSSTLTSQSSASKQTPTTEGRTLLSILSSQSFATAHSSTAPTSTQPSTVSAASKQTTIPPQTTAIGQAPAGPTHQDASSELNVGDEDLRGFHLHKNSPLDPLLAGLLSVFIVTTAVVFIALFLKFRQRMNHPEFHRLQDLPMDDLMEDTPLSRYSY